MKLLRDICSLELQVVSSFHVAMVCMHMCTGWRELVLEDDAANDFIDIILYILS